MSPTLANFLFEVGNFLVLAIALGWVLFRPVRRALDREHELHSKQEDEIARQRTEANRLLVQARQVQEGLEGKMEKRRAELLAEAQQEARRIREEARERQATELRKVEAEMASVRQTQIVALAGPLGRIAGTAVRKLLETLDAESLDLALVRAACRELQKMPEPARQPGAVETARPLEPEARQMLAALLGEEFEERVVNELGAGVRVTTAEGQVDASASALAREAAGRLSDLLTNETRTENPNGHG